VAGRAAIVPAVALVAALAVASAAHAQASVRVHFLQGEQTIAVDRPGATPADALGALLAGPSPEEQRGRVATELPKGLPLLGLEIADGIATVDFGRAFGDGDSASVSARSAQVVLTLTGFADVREVRLLVEGVELATLTRADVLVPPLAPRPAASPAHPRVAASMTVLQLQRRLVTIGYLPQDAATDRFDRGRARP
jgi:Sporulation and spore germination